jgi:ornithine cyclodeaminase/alanine dehydrogenase-like protein (mu-crystallin family)
MGDLHHALNAGVVKREDVHAELGEVVAGRKPGRESVEEVIVFDSTGMALQDVAAVALVYERAIREEVGTALRLAA